MRTFVHPVSLIVAALLTSTSTTTLASAQTAPRGVEETQHLLSGPKSHGGFGSMDARVTRLAGGTALLAGFRAGWLIGHRLSIGAAGWWNATPRVNTAYTLPSGQRAGLGFGYTGLELGWTFRPTSLVHVSAGALLGAGGAYYHELGTRSDRYERTPVDAFIVAEPTLGVDVNIARFVRLGAVAAYRSTSGAAVGTLGDRSLRGASGGLTLKFGRF
jgi:hypothetical protein